MDPKIATCNQPIIEIMTVKINSRDDVVHHVSRPGTGITPKPNAQIGTTAGHDADEDGDSEMHVIRSVHAPEMGPLNNHSLSYSCKSSDIDTPTPDGSIASTNSRHLDVAQTSGHSDNCTCAHWYSETT